MGVIIQNVDDLKKEFGLLTKGGSTTDTNSSNTHDSTSETSGSRDGTTQNKTVTTEAGGKEDVTDKLVMRGSVPFVPRTYEGSPEDRSVRGMLRVADNRRNELKQHIDDSADRERRRSKYLAWTDMLNSLGEVAGLGYAPVQKRDNTRVMQSFAKLDELRKANADIINDPYLSWIEKLALQQRLQFDANEEKRRLQIDKLNADAENRNIADVNRAKIASAQAIKTKNQTSDGTSSSTYSSTTNTEGHSNGERQATSVNLTDLDTEAMRLAARNSANANKPIGTIGPMGGEVEVSAADVRYIVSLYNELKNKVAMKKAQTKQIDGKEYYVIDYGGATFEVPAKEFDDKMNALANLQSLINQDDAFTNNKTVTAIHNEAYEIDADLDNIFAKCLRALKGKTKAQEEPVQEQGGNANGEGAADDEFGMYIRK